MAGFSSNQNGIGVVFGNNVDFSGGAIPANTITTNGQLLIGTTALNVGGTHINVGNLVAADASITIGYSSPNITLKANVSGTDLHTARFIVSAGGGADGANFTTIATAYAAAVAAGGLQTVFVQPGIYTENIVLSANVNLTAYPCDARGTGTESNVTIFGKLSASFTGAVSVSGIQLKTNGDYAVEVTGANVTLVRFINCYLFGFNNNAIHFTSSQASSKCEFYWSQGDLIATFAYFTHSGAGQINFFNSVMANNGASTAASTLSGSGSFGLKDSYMNNAITTSGTSVLSMENSEYHSALILGGTGAGQGMTNCSIDGGTASAASIGAGVTFPISSTSVSSTNTNAITGAGILQYGNLAFTNSSSLINTTTQVPLVCSNNAVRITTPGGYPYTTIPQDAVILVDSSVARTITPLASPTTGQVHIIKDNVGTAAANNITVTPSGKNIDGVASKTITTNFGSMRIVYNGTQWNVI